MTLTVIDSAEYAKALGATDSAFEALQRLEIASSVAARAAAVTELDRQLRRIVHLLTSSASDREDLTEAPEPKASKASKASNGNVANQSLEDVDLLLTPAVARLAGVTPATVRHWERTGQLHSLQAGSGRLIFMRHDVERLLVKRRSGQGAL